MRVPEKSILSLAKKLVRIPSQGGIDDSTAVLEEISAHLRKSGLSPEILTDERGDPVAVTAKITGAQPGPSYCLNACIDTAPAGDTDNWSHPPFAGDISDGRFYGRGAADSKIGVSIFAHLGAELQKARAQMKGSVILLFDADEHTGNFGGVKAFARKYPDIDGMMIGYPGDDAVNIGARGVYRAKITVHGKAEHSGARTPADSNAVLRGAALATALGNVALPETITDDFPQNPKLTVTGMTGGDGYAVVPDKAEIRLDVRLTPGFNAAAAEKLVRKTVADFDKTQPGPRNSSVTTETSWPPYKLDDNSELKSALVNAAREMTGRKINAKVCSPSNIGNYLAGLGIPATCGFGVKFNNMHAADEYAETASIPTIYKTYRKAIRQLAGLETTTPQRKPKAPKA